MARKINTQEPISAMLIGCIFDFFLFKYFETTIPTTNRTRISYLNINSPNKVKNISLNFLFIKISTRTKNYKNISNKIGGRIDGRTVQYNIPSSINPSQRICLDNLNQKQQILQKRL